MGEIIHPADILPHQPPFLFIDEYLELDEKHCVAKYKIKKEDCQKWMPRESTVSGRFFSFKVSSQDCEGHYPGNPIFPGVRIIAAMVQSIPNMNIESIEKVRFLKILRPGDVAVVERDEYNLIMVSGDEKVAEIENFSLSENVYNESSFPQEKLIEIVAQAGLASIGIYSVHRKRGISIEEVKNKMVSLFLGIDKIKFKDIAYFGDTLLIETEAIFGRLREYEARGNVYIENKESKKLILIIEKVIGFEGTK